ncbi:Macro domain-containing protein [Butyrivibrio fibrisolvens]|uniref:Macro domain-containing protein n=1 Tax=Butyrivibrio fibrisolvens TaxID=831 RepID=A0A1H9XB11_BUTFI|nr:Macro domain-containing protein [Butyrivibrio fibrisolvens]
MIRAVGSRWFDGKHNEPKLLYSAYKQSLLIAKENGLHSIGFPLISAGIFGYHLDGAWRKAIQACNDFICNYLDYDIKVIFAVLDDKILTAGEKIIKDIVLDEKVKNSVIKWCEKYTALFHSINEDDELRCFF